MQGHRREWRGEFKDQILTKLRERNKRESHGFTELLKNHQRLYEDWAAIRAENLRLQMRGGDIRQLPGSSGVLGEKEKVLEQKIMRLQEELTDLHRTRGENAFQVLSLSAKLTDKEAELSQSQSQLADMVARIADLEDQLRFSMYKCQELTATNELVRDEHQALHLAYMSLEQKSEATLKENAELVQRYIEIKAQHVNLLDKENEDFVKNRQAQVQKELEEAAKDVRSVVYS